MPGRRSPSGVAAVALLTLCPLVAGCDTGGSAAGRPAERSPQAGARPLASEDLPPGISPKPQATPDAGAVARPSVFVSPDGSDAADCSRSAPCLSMGRAYAVARPGETVELAAGLYGEQQLPADRSKQSSRDVVFQPAPGAAVATGTLVFRGSRPTDAGASHVTVRDISSVGFVTARARDLTFVDVSMRANFAIQGGGDIAVIGGSVGGTRDGSHSEITSFFDEASATTEAPARITIDGVVFHDVRMSRPEDHVECLQVTDVQGLTVRNSRFARCDTFDLRVDRHRTVPRDLVIENNVFQRTSDSFGGNVYYGLAVRAGEGVLIRNNSSDMPWAGPEPGSPAAAWRLVGNVLPGAGCDERIDYWHNVWSGGTRCGATDRFGDLGFVDAEAGDFRLRPGSPAIGAARPTQAPRRDLAGRRRDSAPDAGALEAG